MKIIKSLTLSFSFLSILFISPQNINQVQAEVETENIIKLSDNGTQPSIIIDKNQEVKIAYGYEDKVFFTSSLNHGKTFSSVKTIGQLKDLQLAMTRGVQIANSDDSSVIAATDKHGDVFVWAGNNHDKKWSKPIKINDVAGVAGEGFVSVTGAENNTFYAIWNDFRNKDGNKLYGSISHNGGKTWSKNFLVYKSPDKTICECCRPSIVAGDNGNIYVFFRNQLNGSRDMYLLKSNDFGKTFGKAEKIGQGNWKLKACPMDGGSISVNNNKVNTIWQREGNLFLTEQGKADIKIGKGRLGAIANNNNGTFLTWQSGTDILVKTPQHRSAFSLGKGSYPKIAAFDKLGDGILVWETEKGIMAKKL